MVTKASIESLAPAEEHELEIKLHEDSRHEAGIGTCLPRAKPSLLHGALDEVSRLQSEVIRYRSADIASQDPCSAFSSTARTVTLLSM